MAHNMAKEKYRDNLQEKKQQIKQTFIHATKRQSSGKLNASRVTRYYEVNHFLQQIFYNIISAVIIDLEEIIN